MLRSSRKTHESVAFGGENGAHRRRKASLLEPKQDNVELGGEGDAEVPVGQSEMLERIRVAAGQTS